MHSKLDDSETADVKFQIDDEVIRHILDKLDKVQEKQAFERSHPRIQFRRCGVLVKVEHIGGTRARLRVWTRNISAGGISLVHGSFVHPGSRCEVTVPQRNGELQEVRGVVRWCRLLSGILHEIGVQFEDEQHMELVVNIAQLRDERPDLAATQSTTPTRLDLVKAADSLMQAFVYIIPWLASSSEVRSNDRSHS